MSVAETQIVYLKPGEGVPAEGTLHRVRFNSADRLLNAGKVLGLFWLGALVTVFIPIAHFVLVPSLALAGPIMAFLRYRSTVANKNITACCPKCNKDIEIRLEANAKLPLYTYCPACDASLKVEAK